MVLALALFAAAAGGVLSAGGRRAATRPAPSAKYGGLPSWLPKPKTPINRILSASSERPALATQGETVSVGLAHGHVLAIGPETPEQGKFPVPATTHCTFVVTFAAGSGVIPISPSAFTLVDERGHVRHPRVTSMDGAPPPRQVPPGRTISLKVHDVIPTGDGALEWTPDGSRPLVAWDFVVEID
ncbi:MAG TPA: hypothetical protein VK272_12035 [Solirubrobacteraceae bacterium]|nr:hypothetical protein [Solirubrobacteraceae bacterium]